MTYTVSKNGILLDAGLNRQQALIRINRAAENARADGFGVTLRGMNNDLRVIVTNGSTYEMRSHA